MGQKPAILVTGVSGNLGLRLLEYASDFDVIGVDLHPPETGPVAAFEQMDLAEERSCGQLLDLLRRYRPEGIAHLAFVGDSRPTAALTRDLMWHTNVAGTGRVLEAIAEHNRMLGGIDRFVFPSTALLYGASTNRPLAEDAPLQKSALLYAQHKHEADLTIQARAHALKCKTCILRLQPFAGPGASNFWLSALRGQPIGDGRVARRMQRRNTRFPLPLPSKGSFLEHKFQFVHVDDVARLVAAALRRRQSDPPLSIINVAGRGEPVTLATATRMANTEIKRMPGRRACNMALKFLWNMGVSAVPPEALPFLLGSSVLDTARLRVFLGDDYRKVMQFTCEEALAASFEKQPPAPSIQPSELEQSR